MRLYSYLEFKNHRLQLFFGREDPAPTFTSSLVCFLGGQSTHIHLHHRSLVFGRADPAPTNLYIVYLSSNALGFPLCMQQFPHMIAGYGLYAHSSCVAIMVCVGLAVWLSYIYNKPKYSPMWFSVGAGSARPVCVLLFVLCHVYGSALLYIHDKRYSGNVEVGISIPCQ